MSRRDTVAARAGRQTADAKLAAPIRTIHHGSDGTCGVPRINAELREDGERIRRKSVARLMQAIGLAGLRPRKDNRTTIVDPTAATAAALIGHDFTARP